VKLNEIRILEFGCICLGMRGRFNENDPYSDFSPPILTGSYTIGASNLDAPLKIDSTTDLI